MTWPPLPSDDAGGDDRLDAARRLRDARADRSDESAAWAFATIPDSMPARRLLARRLLENGDPGSADAVIARGLHLRPDDASLALLRAQSLLAQGHLDSARPIIRRALRARPTHRSTILTAARIERGLGDARQALTLLRYGRGEHPHDFELLRELAFVLLDVGRTDEARRCAERLPRDPLLHARIAVSEGRHLDALDALSAATCDARPDVVIELLRLLLACGRTDRARREIDRFANSRHPHVVLECARTAVAIGQLARAAGLAFRLRRTPGVCDAALSVLAVAAGLAERPRLARHALTRRSRGATLDAPDLGRLWARGWGAQLVAEQVHPRLAGSDHNRRILPTLLRRAAEVLDDADAGAEAVPGGHSAAELRERCLEALRPLPRAA